MVQQGLSWLIYYVFFGAKTTVAKSVNLFSPKALVYKGLDLFGPKALVGEIINLFSGRFFFCSSNTFTYHMHASLTVKFYPGKFSFALEDPRILRLLLLDTVLVSVTRMKVTKEVSCPVELVKHIS